jgi:non-ribosomal peptide synthase protein (TIGR01720 family)
MAQTFARWTGQSAHLFDLEYDGREGLLEDVDLSRTIGWFTTMTPVLLDVGEESIPVEALKSVKNKLGRVPNEGAGFGLLRYLRGDKKVEEQLRSLPRADVNFLYLGQVAQGLSDSSLFKPVESFRGQSRRVGGTRSHLLHVRGSVMGGRLRMDWTYSENIHRQETIRRLAEDFIVTLRALITRCLAGETIGYTPTDFPDVSLSQQELDDIVSRITGFGE